jgi:Major Facilitator Superfamily
MARANETARAAGASLPSASWWRVAFAMFAVGWGANQFSPMLIVYRDRLGLSAGTLGIIFGVYALGLVPGLLLGGAASDRFGRRALVIPFVALSPLASLLLILTRESVTGLGVARFLAGVCSGVVFSAASAWVQDLSARAAPGVAARRAAIALSAGFGAGPLVASLLAQWAPDPLWLPYVPHLLLGAAAVAVVLKARETVSAGAVTTRTGARRDDAPRGSASESELTARHAARWVVLPAAVRGRRFRRVIVPLAPWVFGSAAFAFVVLPARISSAHNDAVGFAGLVTALTLGTGVLLQPLAQRLERRRALGGAIVGLAGSALGLALGVLALALHSRVVVACAALPLGAGYGMCLVSGLHETERLAVSSERGATVAVYYALTYVGFSVPYLVSILAGALSGSAILGLFALLALAVLVSLSRAKPVMARAGES